MLCDDAVRLAKIAVEKFGKVAFIHATHSTLCKPYAYNWKVGVSNFDVIAG